MFTALITHLTIRRILLLQALAAALTLGGALVSQYGFELFPCELCLLQRYPYAVIIGVALLAAWRFPARWAVWFCAALFALDAGIALYHTGVELDIFAGPDACSATGGGEQTLEEMRAAILNAPLVSCKQAMAYFLGLSMAAWNALAASFYAVASLLGVRYAKK